MFTFPEMRPSFFIFMAKNTVPIRFVEVWSTGGLKLREKRKFIHKEFSGERNSLGMLEGGGLFVEVQMKVEEMPSGCPVYKFFRVEKGDSIPSRDSQKGIEVFGFEDVFDVKTGVDF